MRVPLIQKIYPCPVSMEAFLLDQIQAEGTTGFSFVFQIRSVKVKKTLQIQRISRQ